MKVILQSFNEYFIRVHKDGSWDETYNPHEATIFLSKTEAVSWAKNKTNIAKYIEPVSDIKSALQKFDEWVANGMVCRHFDAMDNKFNVPYDPAIHTPLDVLKWKYENARKGDDMMIHEEVYETWVDELWDVFDHIHDINGYYDYDSYDKIFLGFTIKVSKESTFDKFKEEMDLLLDNFEFDSTNEEGDLLIDVFEHDLSETRSIYLIMHDRDQNKWGIGDARYGFTPILEHVSLNECFKRLREDYWYD